MRLLAEAEEKRKEVEEEKKNAGESQGKTWGGVDLEKKKQQDELYGVVENSNTNIL